MAITEEALTSDEYEEIAELSAIGVQVLNANTTDTPQTFVAAIGQYVELQRPHIQQASEDDYASLVLSMAYLWDEQVCRAYHWEWVKLRYDNGESKAIVSPNRAFAVYPLFFVKDIIDEPARESTIILLFNMLEPSVLAQQFSSSTTDPYMILG